MPAATIGSRHFQNISDGDTVMEVVNIKEKIKGIEKAQKNLACSLLFCFLGFYSILFFSQDIYGSRLIVFSVAILTLITEILIQILEIKIWFYRLKKKHPQILNTMKTVILGIITSLFVEAIKSFFF